MSQAQDEQHARCHCYPLFLCEQVTAEVEGPVRWYPACDRCMQIAFEAGLRVRKYGEASRRLGAKGEQAQPERSDSNLNPVEAKLPLTFNGLKPATFIKRAYGLGANLNGPGRFDMNDPVQQELRRIRDWITMAEHDALESRRS